MEPANTTTIPPAAGQAAEITEQAIIDFFTAKLRDFSAAAPGYVTLSLRLGIHTTGNSGIEWRAYHEKTGHSPSFVEAAGKYVVSADAAIGYHLQLPKIEAEGKCAELREQAQRMLDQAAAIEKIASV